MVVIWRPVALTVIFLWCSLKFSMMPTEWRDMVERTRELELALGSEEKIVMDNDLLGLGLAVLGVFVFAWFFLSIGSKNTKKRMQKAETNLLSNLND